jgi:hypothetical protein
MQYVPVEGWVRIIRRWDDHLATMSPEGVKQLAGKAMIHFSHPSVSVRKFVGSTDHAIQYDDGWYVPKSDMKAFLQQAYKKQFITRKELQSLLK